MRRGGFLEATVALKPHMASRASRPARDVEKDYPATQFVAKLRRLADCIESGRRFQIQVAGERVSVPPDATINLEHERGGGVEEIEFQLKWNVAEEPADRPRQKGSSR